MATEKSKKAAEHIIKDRNGADYYKDTHELTRYLKSTLSITAEKAEEKANTIHQDRKGANYYADVEILAEYMDG